MPPSRRRATACRNIGPKGLPVRAAAFTNFSRDHLDYHRRWTEYFEAKMRLFSKWSSRTVRP
jgi:UDP-N-acetylmuramyl tripeptide synthase